MRMPVSANPWMRHREHAGLLQGSHFRRGLRAAVGQPERDQHVGDGDQQPGPQQPRRALLHDRVRFTTKRTQQVGQREVCDEEDRADQTATYHNYELGFEVTRKHGSSSRRQVDDAGQRIAERTEA
jgi:hypothetical protein